MAAIKFYEDLPETSFDAHGVTGSSCSGDEVAKWRTTRAVYRRFLETEIRRLNEFEAEERRLARGKILPFKDAVGH